MNNEQSQFAIDAVRDLPPKSPGSKRVIPTMSTKIRRGEVKIQFECNDTVCSLDFGTVNIEKLL
jgi:hypothetical protein